MDMPMKKAITVILFLEIAFSFIDFGNGNQFTPINFFLGFSLQVWLIIACFFLLRQFGDVPRYNTWSYIWRFLIAKYLALSSALFVYLVLPFKFVMPSIPYTIYIFLLMGLFAIFYLWCFFSVNRKAHLIWVIGMFKGY